MCGIGVGGSEGGEVDAAVERVLQVGALSPATAGGDVERVGWRMNDEDRGLWRLVEAAHQRDGWLVAVARAPGGSEGVGEAPRDAQQAQIDRHCRTACAVLATDQIGSADNNDGRAEPTRWRQKQCDEAAAVSAALRVVVSSGVLVMARVGRAGGGGSAADVGHVDEIHLQGRCDCRRGCSCRRARTLRDHIQTLPQTLRPSAFRR